jgi:divalent metal cation (Fe/Co/Zn/Cd) transporter
MAHNSESAIKAALVANGLIAAMKLVSAILSGSASMMAEFKHSLGDWANGFFLLIGFRQADARVTTATSSATASAFFSGVLSPAWACF